MEDWKLKFRETWKIMITDYLYAPDAFDLDLRDESNLMTQEKLDLILEQLKVMTIYSR